MPLALYNSQKCREKCVQVMKTVSLLCFYRHCGTRCEFSYFLQLQTLLTFFLFVYVTNTVFVTQIKVSIDPTFVRILFLSHIQWKAQEIYITIYFSLNAVVMALYKEQLQPIIMRRTVRKRTFIS